MTNLPYFIELTVGDECDDGHGKKESVIIRSSIDIDAFNKAYSEGCKIVGFSPAESMCAEYEENYVYVEQVQALVEHGFDENLISSEQTVNDNQEEIYDYLDVDSYLEMILFVVKLGNKSFDYERLNPPSFHAGGYGLFE